VFFAKTNVTSAGRTGRRKVVENYRRAAFSTYPTAGHHTSSLTTPATVLEFTSLS